MEYWKLVLNITSVT